MERHDGKMKKRCTAVVLAAGSGKRMKSSVAKQFIQLDGKPLIWYALRAMEDSEIIDDCILVTGEEDIPYVRREIVEKYGFGKVDAVIAGGAERCFSVANALQVIAGEKMKAANRDGMCLFTTVRDLFLPGRFCGILTVRRKHTMPV